MAKIGLIGLRLTDNSKATNTGTDNFEVKITKGLQNICPDGYVFKIGLNGPHD